MEMHQVSLGTDKAAEAAARKQAGKEREKKKIEFHEVCTLDNIVVNEKDPQALKGSAGS